MKYAVISDIHGNLPALNAVLEDAKNQGITHFLFAGDYCLSGPWPNECVEVIRAIPEKHIVRGNEERYLENLIGKDQSLWTDGQMEISYWTYRNVSEENRDYVLALPHRTDLECNGVKIHMSHHSTDFIGEYPFATWNSSEVAIRTNKKDKSPEQILSDMAAERENDPLFMKAVAALDEGVYVFGHSHVQWSYASKDGKTFLFNPGSCGLPLDGLKESAPYTVLEISDSGEVTFEEKRVPFDKAAYIAKVKETSQYREAKVWSEVIFRELSEATEQLQFFLAHVDQYARSIGDERRPFAVETWEAGYDSWAKSLINNNK